jgi:serine/threonine protein kinase
MEYAAGGSLHSILSNAEHKAKLSPNSRLYVAEALLAALEYLHANNVFHRDVKPDNMCFWDDWENNPKMVLIDFGIASRVAESLSGSVLTSFPGTIPYMAQEYLLQASQFTAKCEVYAVGVVLVNLLTGECSNTRLEERQTTPDEILSHLDTSAGPWLADTEKEIAATASLCLHKDHAKRPTISELLKTLKRLRALTCTEAHLAPNISKRIHSYNGQSRPTHNLKQVGELLCVVCGMQRLEGALCANRHLTCNSGSCLEEMVREHLGDNEFKCPSPGCAKNFQPIDFYNKLGADLYGEMILAEDRARSKAESSIDLQETILKHIQDLDARVSRAEKNIVGEVRRRAIDIIGTNIAVVRDMTLDYRSIDSNVKLLMAAADKQARLERDLRRRLNEMRIRDEQASEVQHREILAQLENLSLCQAGGVSLMASGRLQCPRLCLLWPVRSNRGIRSRIAIASEYHLVFLCAHDKTPVRTSVIIKEPKKWIKKAAPLIKFALFSLRVMATASGGIPIPSLPDCIVGDSLSDRMERVLREMEILLDPEAIRSLEDWVDGVTDNREWVSAIGTREREISEEAYASLAEEAYKPKNRDWMNEMEIGYKEGGMFAWVKKENLNAWKSTAL